MKNRGIKYLIIILIVLVAIAAILLVLRITNNKPEQRVEDEIISLGIDDGKQQIKKENINIYNGIDRPIAVMIDNHKGAWPQASLNEAYLVYEIIVEGGETRLMPIFKGKNLNKIGPVRSSRHYYLDYALENDAIYVHYGWSPQAEADIKTLKVNNINGITESSKDFWRVKDKSAPHNAVTNTNNILNISNSQNYRTTSNDASVLKYTQEEVNLEEGKTANQITIPYSTLHKVSYTYNKDIKEDKNK